MQRNPKNPEVSAETRRGVFRRNEKIPTEAGDPEVWKQELNVRNLLSHIINLPSV